MDAVIAQVRDFNRYYTRRLGLLTDHYLGQGRSLAEARLLYEIGDGASVRDLRARLGLDSGYLSRLLRTLEGQGLITVAPDPADGRVRLATPTDAGRREVAELDRRSDEGVGEWLAPLTAAQREEFVAAQRRIRRLLRLAAVSVTPVPDDATAARDCLRAYAAELDERFPEGYDPATLLAPGTLTGDGGALLLAEEDGVPAGCAAWRLMSAGVAEVRHLWVAPAARGIGLGRRLLSAVEADAAAHGVSVLRLGTHSVLTEAAALYRSAGYREIPPYDDSPYNHLTFEKTVNP